MSTLKQLSAIYIAAASAYGMALVFSHHPDWAAAARSGGVAGLRAAGQVATVLGDDVVKPGWSALRHQSAEAFAAIADMTAPKASAPGVVARPPDTAGAPQFPPVRIEIAQAPDPKPRPLVQAPALRPAIAPRSRQAPKLAKPAARVTIDIAPPPDAPTSPLEIARVERHLKDALSTPLYDRFGLFLYISKAAKGPVAQRMYVFAKDAGGGLALRYDWPVSTGREKVEYNGRGQKLPSFTPAGYYQLDPHRMYARYRSHQWGTPMPHAMFFNWVHDGLKSGLAIHAAHGDDIARLGQRASGGCIHLSPKDATILFKLIRADYRGEVPRFAYDRKTRTMSNAGELMRGRSGKLVTHKGYKVLVFIENYGGGEDIVATIM